VRAAWYERTGKAREVLVVGEMPDPVPGAGEVRVALRTSGVNPSDWKARMGSRPMLGPRIIPHSDGAGVIDRVGAGVPASRVGERVWVWNGQWKRIFGTCATMITLASEQAVPLPQNVSFEAGACLGIPALTAYRALTTDGNVAGKSVLVTGGAGGVGHYALQLARLLGARQILTTISSEAKASHARAAGADATINYKTENLVERVRELTGGRGVDRIVDLDIAGHGKLIPDLIAKDGIVAAYGTNNQQVGFEFTRMIMTGVGVRFFIVYELAKDVRDAAISHLTRLLEADLLRHAVAATYPLDQIVGAHEAVEQGRHMGNVVVTM
jgi:NADPH2:quinone reductase